MDLLKIIGFAGAGILVLNFVLFSFRAINYVVFWVVLLVTSIVAFGLLHILKKKGQPKQDKKPKPL